MPAERFVDPLRGGEGATRRADVEIAEAAARQHGVVSGSQLRALGLTSKMIEWRLAAGHLHRLSRGVYAVGHKGITREGRWLAAVLACGDEALLSHLSAAALRGVRQTSSSLIHVSSPIRSGRRHRGIRVHSGAELHPDDIATVRGIPCTSLSRTILDCAAVLHPEALDHLVHRAQSRNLLDPAEMQSLLRRSHGRRGVARLRRILGYLEETGEAAAHGGLEQHFMRLCRRFDLSRPEVNIWIPLEIAAGGLEVDFVWREQRLIVETDSRTFHTTDRAIRNDRARDRALALAGWRVLRFTYRDILETPHQVATELRAHLLAEWRLDPLTGG